MDKSEEIIHQKEVEPILDNGHVELRNINEISAEQSANQNMPQNIENPNPIESGSSLELIGSFIEPNVRSTNSINIEQHSNIELKNIQHPYVSSKSINRPITHIQSIYQPPSGIIITETSHQKSNEGSVEKVAPYRRRLSMTSSTERHNWSVQVRHVIREQPEREREETQQNPDINHSASSVSQCGEESELNRQIEQNHLDTFAFNKRIANFEQPDESNDSEVDNEEEKSRRVELMKLAEQNKSRLLNELQQSKRLKDEMDDETPFGQRVFASVMVSTVVGGATALITKNKRNSIIAGFVALAASFIIQ